MSTYYTPRHLAAEMGQSVRTARRVMAEQHIKYKREFSHEERAWWRLDPAREPERLSIEQVRTAVMGGATAERKYGRKRIRQPSLNPLQNSLCPLLDGM